MTIATLDRPNPADVIGLEGLPELLPSDGVNYAGMSDEDRDRGHLSHSSISSLNACTQKFGFQYDLGIEPISRPKPLELGRAFQKGVEASDPKAAMDAIGDNARVFSQADEDKVRIDMAIVGAGVRAYLARWPDREAPVKELEYRVALRNPWTGAYSRTFDLLGYADEVRYEPDGPVLVENKFVGQFTELDVRRLPLDRQIRLGIYGIYRATGVRVERVSYRYTRKPSIRQKQDETVEEFCERLAGDYEARPDFYTHEEPDIACSTNDLVRIEAELWEWAERVRQSRRRNLYPRNTSVCHEYGGCPFLPICVGDPDAMSLYQPKENDRDSASDREDTAVPES